MRLLNRPLVVPFLVPLVLSVVSACATPSTSPSVPSPSTVHAKAAGADDALVTASAKAYLDLLVETSPEAATLLGLHSREADLDDRSKAAFENGLVKKEKLLARVRDEATTVRKDGSMPSLSRTARTDAWILIHTLEMDIRTQREENPLERRPSLYASPMEAIFIMLARDYAPAAERATHALARMEKIPTVLAAARTNLKSPPKVWTQVGIEMAESAKTFFEEQRAPLEAALPGEKQRIDHALKTASSAYADYKTFLEKEVLPRSNGDFAAGRPLFDFMLQHGAVLGENADDVLALGQRILATTEAQMSEIAKRIDPNTHAKGGWPDVVARVKANHPTAADLIPSYRRELQRAREFLVKKDAVPFPPGDDCEVIETPPFQRSTVTAAYDEPPPFDRSTKGFFYVTPVEASFSQAKQEAMLRENDHADQVDTAVHEAYPGHHLQLSFARLHPSLIRKITGPAIFAEGWGLYAEELMSELGYYTDEERLMQLEWTLVRAARVVIDVGLHTRGMTFDQAVAILTDKVHLERPLALSEVKRYTMSPTQPLSYLVGREALFKLRERYRAREGSKFTLKRFHTEALSHGTIAPGLLEQEMFEP